MKKFFLFVLVLCMLMPLFAGTADNTYKEWKIGQSDNTFSFKVKFSGVSYTEIGFSKSKASYASGQGLVKSDIDNNSLTLSQTAVTTDSNNITHYEYSSGKAEYYIYWYVSIKTTAKLKLQVDVTKDKSVTVSGKAISANTLSLTCETYDYSSSTTPKAVSTTVSTAKTNTATIANFPTKYAVYQGNSAFSAVTASVYQYPTNRRIGTLTLTLETSS